MSFYLLKMFQEATPSSPMSGKWFSREWKLQELIAPRNLVFLSQDWTMIGTKASLASLLEKITGIDADVLTFRRSVADVSVARH